jgi:hypothetical protein
MCLLSVGTGHFGEQHNNQGIQGHFGEIHNNQGRQLEKGTQKEHASKNKKKKV